MVAVIWFLLGCVALFVGAHWLITGAVALAEYLRIPKHVVGLTLVAVGTSAPELFVNVLAAARGKTDFALANVSGSNLANICIGFGVCAIMGRLTIQRRTFQFDVRMVVFAPLFVYLSFYLSNARQLPFMAVIPLSLILAVYLYSLSQREDENLPEDPARTDVRWGSILFCGGIAGLYFGGELILKGAVDVAQGLGVPDDLIGMSIIALGTSIPDISASIMAARRGEHGIAVGNLLGSNISNVLLILTLTVLVSGDSLPTNAAVRTDYAAVIFVSLLLMWLASRSECISRRSGGTLVAMYVAYIAFRVVTVA